jgi:hypothetical protein
MTKKISFILIAIIILYFGSYMVNSATGGYWRKPESDGKHKVLGVDLKTALLWQPRFGYYSATRTDIIGAIYIPLIWIDRGLFHKTLYITDFSTWGKTATTKFHPDSK